MKPFLCRKKYEKCQDSCQQKWKENGEVLKKKNDDIQNLRKTLSLALEEKQQAEQNYQFTQAENTIIIQELKKLIGKRDYYIVLLNI